MTLPQEDADEPELQYTCPHCNLPSSKHRVVWAKKTKVAIVVHPGEVEKA